MQKEKWKTMDVILVILAIFLLVFVIVMIAIYIRTGGIPDTLCTCVFSVCGGECGVMGWMQSFRLFVTRRYPGHKDERPHCGCSGQWLQEQPE